MRALVITALVLAAISGCTRPAAPQATNYNTPPLEFWPAHMETQHRINAHSGRVVLRIGEFENLTIVLTPTQMNLSAFGDQARFSFMLPEEFALMSAANTTVEPIKQGPVSFGITVRALSPGISTIKGTAEILQGNRTVPRGNMSAIFEIR